LHKRKAAVLTFNRAFTREKIMRKYVLLLVVTALLAGCGLKGPLYIPEQKPAAAPPSAPAAAAQTDDKKTPAAPVSK
jgi:predicted small lipoprotein YifL